MSFEVGVLSQVLVLTVSSRIFYFPVRTCTMFSKVVTFLTSILISLLVFVLSWRYSKCPNLQTMILATKIADSLISILVSLWLAVVCFTELINLLHSTLLLFTEDCLKIVADHHFNLLFLQFISKLWKCIRDLIREMLLPPQITRWLTLPMLGNLTQACYI